MCVCLPGAERCFRTVPFVPEPAFGPVTSFVQVPVRMRVLLINDVAKYLNGGANRVVVETLEGLHRRGMAVGCVYQSFSSELSPEIWTRKVPHGLSATDLRTQILAAIADFRPDVIQCHTSQIISTYPHWVPDHACCQFVHDESWYCSGGNRVSRSLVHCQRPHSGACLAWHVLEGCGGRSPRGNILRWRQVQERTVLRRFAHLRVQVASAFMARGLVENGYPTDRLDVIPLYAAAPAITDTPTEPGLIVLPSRLVYHKGVHVLIAALAQLRALPWRLVVPGDGPEKLALQEQARRLGVAERVELPGELHPDLVATWYARAQIVAFPVLREEPFGLVGTEALAHGKPIVAFAGGAVDEWLWPGETGLKVAAKTPTALAAALRELLIDPARCAAMGAAARRRYSDFTQAAFLYRLLLSLERTRSGRISGGGGEGE